MNDTTKAKINLVIGSLEMAAGALRAYFQQGAVTLEEVAAIERFGRACDELRDALSPPAGLRRALGTAGVVLTYKADTSQAKAAIKELSYEERAFAQERLAAIEAGNQALDDQMRKWQALAATVNAATGAVEIARKALTAYATETLKLSAEEVAAIALGKKPLDDE